MPRRVVQCNSIACDIGEEGTAPCQLIVEVVKGVNDEVDRRFQMSGNGKLADKALRSVVPVLARLRGEVVTDDHEQIIVGPIAAFEVLNPAAPRIRTE